MRRPVATRRPVSTIPRGKIGKRLGALDDASILAVNRSLAVFLGFV